MEQTIKLEKILDYVCLQLWYAELYDKLPTQEWTIENAKAFRQEAKTVVLMLENVYGLAGGPISNFHGIPVNSSWKHYLENRWGVFEHPKGE